MIVAIVIKFDLGKDVPVTKDYFPTLSTELAYSKELSLQEEILATNKLEVC